MDRRQGRTRARVLGRSGTAVAVALVVTASALSSMGPAHAVAGPIAPANLSITVQAGKINAFPFSASASPGGAISWSAPNLPAGLSLDPASGILSGRVLTASPATTYTVTALDSSDGTSSSTGLTITVVPVLTPPAAPIVASVGVALSPVYTFVAEGFIAPTFTLGVHPAWLGIDIDGTLTGTPDSAATPFTLSVTATDATGASAVTSASVSVAASALAPASQLLIGQVGTALSPAGVAFPAGAALTYATTPDLAAATGLTFTPGTGAISGTPTKPVPPSSFIVQQRSVATGAVLGESTASVTVDGYLGAVLTPIKVASGLDMGSVVPFGPASAQLAGLVGAASFAVSPALPSGIFLDATTGALTGVPLVAGSKDYTITATDSRGAKASGTFTLGVTGQLTPATQTIMGAVATSLSSAPMTAGGMRAPVTYSILPAIPGGLLFDTATGVVSGVPTVPLASGFFTITATDGLGAKSTATLTLTIAKTTLDVPVIGTVTGGTQIGSLIVYFARPSFAPAGQQFTVKVFDSLGATLVTSVTTLSSPTTITGLVGGETYQVIVVANQTATFDATESLPKTGTASSSLTSQQVVVQAAGTVTNVSKLPTSTLSVAHQAQLTAAGITIPAGTQSARVSKVFSAKPPSGRKSSAPKIHVPLNTNVSLVLSGVKVKDRLEVFIKVKRFTFVSVGFITAKGGQLTVPTLSGSKPGMYLIRFSPEKGGQPGYIKVFFDKPSGSSGSTQSSNASLDGF